MQFLYNVVKKSNLGKHFPVTDNHVIQSMKTARAIKFAMEEFLRQVVERLMALAFSVDIRPKFISIAEILVVSTFMGPTTKFRIRTNILNQEMCMMFP